MTDTRDANATAGDFSVGNTNQYLAWDTSEGTLSVQGVVQSATFNEASPTGSANVITDETLTAIFNSDNSVALRLVMVLVMSTLCDWERILTVILSTSLVKTVMLLLQIDSLRLLQTTRVPLQVLICLMRLCTVLVERLRLQELRMKSLSIIS